LLEDLIEALTIGETYFFRHRSYFDMLEKRVLPELIAERRKTRQLRIWCAGCATGEEAYSLAILVSRLLPDPDAWQVSILATDLNGTFLARADAGLYSEWSFRETDAAFREAHFTAEGTRYRIRGEFRRRVRFAPLNLAAESYPSAANGTAAVDLILCRNVLLYFAPELARQVVGRLRAALVPGGWLVLGPSDPLPGLLAGFDMHASDHAIVYRRAEPATPARSRTLVAPLAQSVGAPVAAKRIAATPTLTHRSAVAPVTVGPVADWRVAWRAARASANDGRLEEAEAHCRQAIASASLRPEPYYLLGTLRQTRGDDQAALAAFRQATYADGAFVPALLGLATLYRRNGASDRARHTLVRTRRLLDGRPADEPVLPEEGLTVGRLRDALLQAMGDHTERHS